MINNLELIKPLLSFESKDDFYHLQVIKRKKEDPLMKSNSRSISHYYVNSPDYLDLHWEEIVQICDATGARAMINLNVRSFKTACINMREVMLEYEKADNYKFMYRAFSKAVAKSPDTKSKLWILDVDQPFDPMYDINLRKFINTLRPQLPNREFTIVPSMSGYHLITKPFDKKTFKDTLPEIEIKKNSLTNLYIPNI